MEFTTFYQILCLLGIPSLFTILGWGYRKINEKVKKNGNETKAVQLGVQAVLRGQMINDYNKWTDRGYAPIYARESFENSWKQYHNLGANGVMDDIHNKFMALPTNKPNDK